MQILILISMLLLPAGSAAAEGDPGATLPDSASLETPLSPLLRSGSFIREARGTLARENPAKPWIFTIMAGTDERPLSQEFTLLPSHLLEEVELEIMDHGSQEVDFVLSGQVLLYRNRNYLILEHVEMEADHGQRPGTAPEDVPAPETVDELDEDGFDFQDQGDSIAAIVSQLQKDIGPLKRSVDRSGELTPGPRGFEEGVLLVSRRGRLVRGNHGAWIFVFDADSRGLLEPPMILMPSSTLEKLEAWARKTGMKLPLLISGQVYSYRGRHFMLPTAWRAPIERPNLK